MPAAIELANVFRAAGPAYRAEQAGHLSLDTLKVMAAIEVGHDLLQRACLAAQVLDLVGGRGPSRVTGQPLLASFQELLGPAVVHRLAMPSRRHSSAMLSSPRRPSSTMRIFSSTKNCRRVARRIS